jgi:uncharacterized protein YcbX
MVKGRITGLYTYPVKSCAGVSLEESQCNELGLVHDREWVVVNSSGKVLTQRDKPRMSLIQPKVAGDGTLTLCAANYAALTVAPHLNTYVEIELWGDDCGGFDQGSVVAGWLTQFLEVECRLLLHHKNHSRKSRFGSGLGRESRVAFADCCPLLIMSEESLSDLNNWLSEPVTMDRFRPSVVISGMGKYAEDRIKTLYVNGTKLQSIKPCARCVIVTIDQKEGISKGPDPLHTLNKFRRQNGKVLFGQYFMAEQPGLLRVGDVVLTEE